MLEVRMIVVGKLKERYLEEGCAEYLKRLGAYCKPRLLQLEETRLPERPSAALIEKALRAEGERILQKADGSYLISLCIEGEGLSSEALSERLLSLPTTGVSAVSFAIGSSYGLSGQVKEASRLRLSMSGMTFPHQLARLMLLEQVYRALSIPAGSKYHK